MVKTFTVTQEHIDQGERYSPTACPIARSLVAAGFTHACVAGRLAKLSLREEGEVDILYGLLSRSAARFIADFDKGIQVTPIRFRVVFAEEAHSEN